MSPMNALSPVTSMNPMSPMNELPSRYPVVRSGAGVGTSMGVAP